MVGERSSNHDPSELFSVDNPPENPLEQIFMPDFPHGFKKIRGASGREVWCYVEDTKIELRDVRNPDYRFKAATVDLYGEKVIEFDINTRNARIQSEAIDRQPDIYPAIFFSKAIEYFDKKEPGKPIEAIYGLWYKHYLGGTSDNFVSYTNALKGVRVPTREQKEAAAMQTWTGQQAAKNGFTLIEVIRELPDYNYRILFRRPSP